ncbi:CapA family protein [Opitutus sp. ER46]|uniref:CapA family protein n=1 Tax=Opitutus sp. ER46 TaxID=2161864 RepID=UPI000D30C748|nr:CapA family protein [Opitutus sp. ER46]PTX95550.1 hypothetical protein DB354_09005 [Opitutus sp. ER46]
MTDLVLLGDLAPVQLADCRLDHAATAAGLVLANLETPLAPREFGSSPKAGPVLRGEAAVLPAWKAAWPNLLVTLANNHMADLGAPGLEETWLRLRAAGIPCLGAAKDAGVAAEPWFADLGGLRVAVLALADRWFGVARPDRPGTNPLTPACIARIRMLRAKVDRLIVTVHGGSELSAWPSPTWQDWLRSMVAAGADIVHAHHPHVPQGWERFQQGWIFYGLGNTLVNPAAWPHPATRRSWRAHLDLANLNAPPVITAWTCETSARGSATLQPEGEVPAHAPEARERNDPLSEPTMLEALHQEYALRLWASFYADRSGLGDTPRRGARLLARVARDALLALLGPSRWRAQRQARQLYHYHLFASITHAEELATALGLLGGELPDRRTPQSRARMDAALPPALLHH